MYRCKLKDIKTMVKLGIAIDITTEDKIPDGALETEACSVGIYGINGCVCIDKQTGQRYAIIGRSSNLFRLI